MEKPIDNKAQNRLGYAVSCIFVFCDRRMKARSRQNIWRERAFRQDYKKFQTHKVCFARDYYCL